MFRNMANKYPSGKYVVSYKGTGTITYSFAAKKIEAESRPGRDIIDVNANDGGAGVLLTITSIDPNKTGDYIRDISVVPLAQESTYQNDIFNPVFLEGIKKYKVLRFMDWMHTNNSTQKDWNDRPKLSSNTYTIKGAPAEIMVKLSNRMQADPWFTLPHMATDDYMRQFAMLVKAQLAPERKIYLEYSNEVWNWMFTQARWANEQAIAKWGTSANYINWYGERTAQMCNIWKEVFADNPARVTCIMSGQAVNPWIVTQALECPQSAMKPCYQHGISALAIAPYFGILNVKSNASQLETWTLDQLFQELLHGGVLMNSTKSALQENLEWITNHATLAKKYNLHLMAYEGGQHLSGLGGAENNDAITALFISANRDPRIGQVYTQYLNNWKQAGGGLFMHFVDVGKPSKWGSWGSREDQTQTSTPKHDALMNFIDANPRWWQ